MAAFHEGDDRGEARIEGFFGGTDLDRHGDLEEAETCRVERIEAFGDFIEADMADTVVSEVAEHGGLLGEGAFFRIMPVDTKREKGGAGRSLGDGIRWAACGVWDPEAQCEDGGNRGAKGQDRSAHG